MCSPLLCVHRQQLYRPQQLFTVFFEWVSPSLTSDSGVFLNLTLSLTSLWKKAQKQMKIGKMRGNTWISVGLLPCKVQHSFYNVASLFGACFTEQGTVRLQNKLTFKRPAVCGYKFSEQLKWRLTFANFSPSKLLTQLRFSHCSRRSTLFPIMQMGSFSSVESLKE